MIIFHGWPRISQLNTGAFMSFYRQRKRLDRFINRTVQGRTTSFPCFSLHKSFPPRSLLSFPIYSFLLHAPPLIQIADHELIRGHRVLDLVPSVSESQPNPRSLVYHEFMLCYFTFLSLNSLASFNLASHWVSLLLDPVLDLFSRSLVKKVIWHLRPENKIPNFLVWLFWPRLNCSLTV